MAEDTAQKEQEVQINHFRLDLFYRLNVLSIKVPALRERIDDIPALARQILSELEQELQLPKTPFITDSDMVRLCAYKWPGNVRELRNVLERAVIVSEGSQLKFDFLECEISDSAVNSWTVFFPPQPSFAHVITEMRRSLIQEALSRARGNKQEASRLLGVSRFVLRRQMKTLGMHVPKSHKTTDQDGPK